MVVILLISSHCFPQWLHQFTISPTVHEGSLFSTSSSILVVCWFIDGGHSDRCEMVSPCGFNLHFPNDYWCWASLHMSVGHLCVLFGEVSIQVLCLFFIIFLWGFLVLSCTSFLNILDFNSLLDVSLINISSHLVGCIFVWLIVSFAMQKFLVCGSLFFFFYFLCSRRHNLNK